MTTPQFAAVPAAFQSAQCSFNISNSTLGKVLLEPALAAAETATSPRYHGGLSLLDLVAASTDPSIRDFLLWRAAVTTTQDAALTGVVSTTATTVDRITGSFIADGWRIGDIVSVYAPSGIAAVAGTEGLFGSVSAVSALSLTFTVIGTAWSIAVVPNGARICKMSQLFRASVPANAGNTAAIPNFSFLNNPMDSSLLRFERKLGLTEMLVLQPVAALTGLPITISFTAQIVRY